MKKRVTISIFVIIFVGLFSGTLGYIAAYVQGLQKANDMVVMDRAYTLLTESYTLARKIESSGMLGLIDAVELNCQDSGSFISVNKPLSSASTINKIDEALEVWEKTKIRLEGLRTLYQKNINHIEPVATPYN